MGGEVCDLCKGTLIKVEQRIFKDESAYDILRCDKCNRKIIKRIE